MSFNNFPNASATTIIPSNYHRGKSVRQYVEHYTESQRLKFEQALDVQGVEAVIWNKHLSKRYCTCQQENISSMHNNQAVLNQDVYLQEKLKQEEFSDFVEKESKGKRKIKKTSLAQDIANQNGLTNLAEIVDSLYESDTTEEPIAENKAKTFSRQDNQIEEALLAQRKHLGLEFNEYSNCPICFSTRHVDTFQPHKGQRFIFDASDFYKLQTKGVIINKEAIPWTFSFINTDSYVEWELELPKYFTVESIRSFNFDKVQTDCVLDFRDVNSTTYAPLNIKSLNSRAGLKNNLKIRAKVRDDLTSKESNLTTNLTHVEIILKYVSEFDKIDMPAIEVPESLEYIEIFLRSRFILSPRISDVMRGSILLEKKLNLCWEVLDVTKIYTAEGKIVNQEVDVRLVQNSERHYLLNYLDPKFSMWKSGFISTPTHS